MLRTEALDLAKNICNLNDKIVITGSLSILELVRWQNHKTINDNISDIDLALTAPITQEELSVLVDFFGLVSKELTYIAHELKAGTDAKTHLGQEDLFDIWNDSKMLSFWYGRDTSNEITIDLFNNIIPVDDIHVYNGYKFTHPSVSIKSKIDFIFKRSMSEHKKIKHIESIKQLVLDSWLILNGVPYIETAVA